MTEKLKALIVEDNVHMRALLRSLLYAVGIRDIRDASNGDAALEILADSNVDVVITDLSMQPTDGIAFTRAVRTGKNCPNPYVPIIMVTGHTERHRVEAARDAGVTEFLAKPITMQNLFRRLSEIVERPRCFVQAGAYFGPDRRRRSGGDHVGPWRRQDDGVAVDVENA